MSLRREFSEHKGKTIESFNLVNEDISTLNLNLLNARTMLASIEGKITELGIKVNGVNQNLRADIEIQNSTNASMASKIVDINSFVNARISNFEREIGKIESNIQGKVKDSTDELASRINAADGRFGKKIADSDIRLKKLSARNRKISKKVTASSNSIKKLVPRSKSQSAKARKMWSSLNGVQEEVRKLKNLLNRKVRSMRKTDEEIEAKVKSHRRRMQQLNRKIGATAGKRPASRRKISRAAGKTITRKITPKKIVTTIKTPKRKITKTVTKNKVITKKETPRTKEIYEVIREKKPLI